MIKINHKKKKIILILKASKLKKALSKIGCGNQRYIEISIEDMETLDITITKEKKGLFCITEELTGNGRDNQSFKDVCKFIGNQTEMLVEDNDMKFKFKKV